MPTRPALISLRVSMKSMTAFTGFSYSGQMAKSYSASPCPGPSKASVASPRLRKRFS
jgi:hypothetical protein